MKLFKRTVTLLISLILISGISIYFLVFFDSNTSKIKSRELKQISQLLDEYNIEVKNDCIPVSYPDLPVISLKNALHDRLDFAEQVLGRNFSVMDSQTYTRGKQILSIDKNSFNINLSDVPLMEKYFLKAQSDKYGGLIKKAVSKLNFDESEILISVNEKENHATVFKTVDGFPVFDCSFKVSFGKNGISKISGIWFELLTEKTYQKHRPLISVFNEICQNTQLHKKTITEITPGYKIGELSDYKKEVSAYPVWRVTFDNKITYDYIM